MAATSKIENFPIHFALLVVCSRKVGASRFLKMAVENQRNRCKMLLVIIRAIMYIKRIA